MGQQFTLFIVRWVLNSLALWVATRLLGGLGAEVDPGNLLVTFLVAGLILSIVNVILKPIIVILSLPAILVTLGLFTLIVNGFMVYITTKIAPGLDMPFGAAIVAGIVVSLVNYVLTGLLQLRTGEKQ